MRLFRRRENRPTIILKVPSMHCGNCEKRVKALLDALPGVRENIPNSADGVVTVVLNDQRPSDEAAIRAALAAGGYPAE